MLIRDTESALAREVDRREPDGESFVRALRSEVAALREQLHAAEAAEARGDPAAMREQLKAAEAAMDDGRPGPP
jgi:hypothetical protein